MENRMKLNLNDSSFVFDSEIVSLLLEIEEFKGSWKAYGNLAPERLRELQRIATIESVGSSTRIEGSRLSDAEVSRIMAGLSSKSFATRDEQEVAGYALLLNRYQVKKSGSNNNQYDRLLLDQALFWFFNFVFPSTFFAFSTPSIHKLCRSNT